MNTIEPAQFTSSPLRNRIRIELKAPVAEVWALVGDLTRFPEYSLGLDAVEAKLDQDGRCTEYVCHFKPQEDEAEGVVHRELVHWYELNRGFASVAEEDNAFGLTNSLTLMTLEPAGEDTILDWEQHYDARDLDTMKAAFEQALADIGDNLVRRFGGKVRERYTEG